MASAGKAVYDGVQGLRAKDDGGDDKNEEKKTTTSTTTVTSSTGNTDTSYESVLDKKRKKQAIA